MASMASKIPNAWDEDWDKLAEKSTSTPPPPSSRRPNPTAAPFDPHAAPRILRAAAPEFNHPLSYATTTTGQPKSLYKPELKILKRSSPDAPSYTPPTTTTSKVPEKERQERELKERERRYKEVRCRIMGNAVPGAPLPAAAQVAPVEAGKTPGKKPKNGKRTPESNTPTRVVSAAGKKHKPASSLSSPRGPSPAPTSRTPSRTTSRKPSPPGSGPKLSPNSGESTTQDPSTMLRSCTPTPSVNRSSSPSELGTITSLSLNGGEFTAGPIPTSNRLYPHKIDGKLLESQLITREDSEDSEDGRGYLGEGTEAEGLDWDSFSRDKGWGPQQQQSQQWGGYAGGGGDYGYAVRDYTTAATGANYDYLPQFQPRQQNPAIYGGSAAMDAQVQGKFNGYTEKQGRAPGASQSGVVQPVGAPREPDSDGGRGFKGRGASRGVNGIAEKARGIKLQEGGVREFVPGGSTWWGQ